MSIRLFTFKCPACGHEFDKFIDNDDENPKCPKCNIMMEKIISATSFQLKGSRWSKDGYR